MNVSLMIMSGVDDGLLLSYSAQDDGRLTHSEWILTIGRRDESDVCLRNDTFISRDHARLHWRDDQWSLEDCDSKNGTYIEGGDDDVRVSGTVMLEPEQLFRIGRTWLRLQPHG